MRQNSNKGIWNFILKNKLIFAGLTIFLSPFVGVQIYEFNKVLGKFPLMDFGLPLKDFFTVWISLWGVIGVVLTIFLSYRRLNSYEKTELNNRYAKAIELLGNPYSPARIGGAINLSSLAKEYPESYKEEIFDILCSHIRFQTNNEDYKDKYEKKPSVEIQIIIDMLFKQKDEKDFVFENCRANLIDCFLKGVNLEKARIVASNFENLSLDGADLTDCNLKASNFIKTTFKNCELNRTRFDYSRFRDCNFHDIKGIPVFSFCYLNDVKMAKWNIGEYGCEFKGVEFRKTSFKCFSIFRGDFTAASFVQCNIDYNSRLEECFILGIDYSKSNNIETILFESINRPYDYRKEDIHKFENELHHLIKSNINRYNRILDSVSNENK